VNGLTTFACLASLKIISSKAQNLLKVNYQFSSSFLMFKTFLPHLLGKESQTLLQKFQPEPKNKYM